jgi:hypothetical protein
MGWNQGYTIFEATVVGAYDQGKLDKDLLRVLMEPYRGSDIDSGGSRGLQSKDGLFVEEIVIKTFGGKLPKKPDFKTCGDDKTEAYWEKLGTAFNKITDKFDWR